MEKSFNFPFNLFFKKKYAKENHIIEIYWCNNQTTTLMIMNITIKYL